MGQPQTRQRTVDLRARDPETGERYYDEDFARQALTDLFIVCAETQHAEGGTFIIAPIRTQMQPAPDALTADPVWANLGAVVQHTFTPPARRVEPQPRPQLEDDMAAAFEQADEAFPDEMRDEDERAVAQALEGDEPNAVMPQQADPSDVHTEGLSPADLMPQVQ